jgi:cell division protein FtsW
MMRRPTPLLLLLTPALVLGMLGVLVSASSTSRQGGLGQDYPQHFTARHLFALSLAIATGFAITRLGVARLLRFAPYLFLLALLAALAVFIPGVGVRAAGASRWIHLGPLSGGPAPFLTLAVALLVAAWANPGGRNRIASDRPQWPHGDDDGLPRATLALVMTFVAVLSLVVQPDFSAAGVTMVVALVALAGLGVGARWLVPASAALAGALALAASRFHYVGGRLHGFLSPESDRRGKGFEVLALAHARASALAGGSGVGLGHGSARRSLSSPESDYVFAVVIEELGKLAAVMLVVAWLCIGFAAIWTAHRTSERRLAAAALGAGVALLAPAALHIAVCVGWIPIIGVSMPLVSYDPAAVLAAGAEIGIIAAVALTRAPA